MSVRLIIIAFAIMAIGLMAVPALAQTDIPAGSARVSPLPPATPQPLWNPPPPSGPSAWCRQNPAQCQARKTGDPLVRSPRDHCVDRMGNGDGYSSMWEFQAFESACR